MKLLAWLCGLTLCVVAFGSAQTVCAENSYDITPDVVYGHKAGMALTFDVVRPRQKDNGVGILFMVSGGWVSRWIPPEALVAQQTGPFGFFTALLDEGYTLFLVRHGSSPYFKVPEAVADVRRATRFIRLHAADYGVDPERLGVCGGSAGGHLSLMLGTTADEGDASSDDPVAQQSDRVAAVVAYFPPTKLDEFFKLDKNYPALDFDHELAESVSPLLHVTPDDAPTLLIHGNEDTLVPLDNSERIEHAFEDKGVVSKLIVVQGAGHGFQGEDNKQAGKDLVQWFNDHLLKSK